MRLLLVDVDSLRPDHLGCYGYDRDTSPTIDGLAADGVRFERCYASDTPCLPSRTAMATCRFGAKSGVVTHYGSGQWYDDPGSGHDPDADRPPSFRHLAENGVHTASISSFSQRHLAHHFAANFQESITPTAKVGELAIEEASDVTPIATDWIERHADEDDWLLHVNYWDVHHPYKGVEPYVDEVRDSGPAAPWPDEDAIEAQRGATGPRTADQWPVPDNVPRDYDGLWPMPERVDSRADVEQFLDGYDAAVRRIDDEIATLLAALDAAGIREDTAVVITADHGEAFGEHGIYAEHAFPHPACQNVPMIVSWPGVTDGQAGVAVDEQVYQFDLMATICEVAGVDVPEGWDAESFAPALRGDGFDGRETIVAGHGIYTFGRAVYRGDWLYVRLLHPGVYSHPGLFNDPDALPGEGLELLHDLDADPHMTENLIADEPERAAELRGALSDWVDRHVSRGWRDQRPVSSRGEDPLAAMASYGPFLYVDPDRLLDYYREQKWDDHAEALARTLDRFPRSSWTG